MSTLPVFLHSIHLKNTEFVALQKTSKHYLISIFLPQRKGETYLPHIMALPLVVRHPHQKILDQPVLFLHLSSSPKRKFYTRLFADASWEIFHAKFSASLTSWILGIGGEPPWASGSVLDNISPPPGFKSRRGHIWRMFHLWLRFITLGGSSAHLAYHVHQGGRKTSIIIITCCNFNVRFFMIVGGNAGRKNLVCHFPLTKSLPCTSLLIL